MYYPDFDTFAELSSRGNLIPVYREIMADMDTPVSAFRLGAGRRVVWVTAVLQGDAPAGLDAFILKQ